MSLGKHEEFPFDHGSQNYMLSFWYVHFANTFARNWIVIHDGFEAIAQKLLPQCENRS